MQIDANFLPAILQMKNRARQFSAESQALRAGSSFKKTIGLGWSEKIYDGLDADHHCAIHGFLQFQADFTRNLATLAAPDRTKTAW